MKVDASPRTILAMPYESPVRRAAVRAAAQDASVERVHRCECGARYLAVGRPAAFYRERGGETVLICVNARCRRVL